MKKTLKEVNLIVEEALEEYFSMTGISLPTAGSVSHQGVGPYHHHIGSILATLDNILDIVDNDASELDKTDAQELIYQSIPRLMAKITTITNAVERRTGFKPLDKIRPEPLTPPKERKLTKLKIK